LLVVRARSAVERLARSLEDRAMVMSEQGSDDDDDGEDKDVLRETPHTRRAAIVGASCCTSTAGPGSVAGDPKAGVPWHLAKGSRRFCNYLMLLALAPRRPALAESQQGQVYVDARNGFSLRPPLDWAQASKSGAEVIFKDPSYKFNNLGVTVTPVRVGSLEEFATVEEAADRLISFEKNKESTKVATLNHLSTREAAEGLVFYDFDYSLETTRGNKRVLSTVCIQSNKLFIANGQYFCGDSCGEDASEKLSVIREALETFRVTPTP